MSMIVTGCPSTGMRSSRPRIWRDVVAQKLDEHEAVAAVLAHALEPRQELPIGGRRLGLVERAHAFLDHARSGRTGGRAPGCRR